MTWKLISNITGARVIISDLQENLHLLQHNIDKNKVPKMFNLLSLGTQRTYIQYTQYKEIL